MLDDESFCRVVILGVAPSAPGQRAWASLSASGRRLAELAGLESADDLEQYFILENLVAYPEPSRRELREAGKTYNFREQCRHVLAGTEVVRALGKRAHAARDDRRLPWHRSGPGVLEWYESAERIVMSVLPHPSGKNRWYNDPRCRRAAERFVRDAVRGS